MGNKRDRERREIERDREKGAEEKRKEGTGGGKQVKVEGER